jgi:hypothetical protein
MIASNEFEEAWIDEGINSFYEAVVVTEEYQYMIQFFGLRVTPFELNRLQQGDGRYSDAIVQPAWSYRSGGSYGLNSYARPAVMLLHLQHLMGEATFARAMRRFFQTWRFRHPTTADFESIMLEEAENDIGWFLDQALHSDRRLDYRIRSARSRRHKEPTGWFWDHDGKRALLGVGNRDDDEDGESSDADDADDEDKVYRSEIVVDRRGEFIHPVTVELVFDDGEVLRHRWDGRSRWKKYVEIRPAKLVSAEVDPDDLLVLDVDQLNNSRRLEEDSRATAKMITHLVFWLQNLFQMTAMVG